MQQIDKRIGDFIRKHHVLTLATAAGDMLHCSNLFYSYTDGRFHVTSSEGTLHVEQLSANPRVAGSVVLETSVVGKLQGIQFRGRMYRPEGADLAETKKSYLKRFPFAAVMDLDLWVIELTWVKFTDNRLGFGKKLIWEREW